MKKVLVNVARIVLTAACVLLVWRMIRFEDRWHVKAAGRDYVAESVETRADGVVRVTLEKGQVREWERAAVQVSRIEGFTSIVKRVDKLRMAGLSALLIVPLTFMALRWWLLMRANGFDVPFGRIFAITYAGSFFNAFLPGGVGGDIAKAVMTASGQERKAAAVGTVLLDRIIGLVAMILMATVAVVPFVTDVRMRTPVIVVGALLLGMIVGYVVYFSRGLRESALGRWVKGRLPFASVIRDLDGVMQTMRKTKATLAAALALSVACQAGTIVVVYLMARTMGITAATPGQFFLFEPIIFIITALPISMGGWGVQEGAYVLLFGLAGVAENEAIALSLMYKAGQVLMSLPGGLLFALGAGKTKSLSR
jgi:hypothetical protein